MIAVPALSIWRQTMTAPVQQAEKVEAVDEPSKPALLALESAEREAEMPTEAIEGDVEHVSSVALRFDALEPTAARSRELHLLAIAAP